MRLMFTKMTAQGSFPGHVLLVMIWLAGCGGETPAPSGAPERSTAVSVDLGVQLAVPPRLVQPYALPGLSSISGVANTETDRDGETYTWQNAEEMVVELNVAGRPRQHELRVRAQPFPLPDGTPQSITPIVNGETLRRQRVNTHREELAWDVPADALREGRNILILRAGYATAPAAVKPGARDLRTLAYRVYGVSFAAAGRQGPDGGQVELLPNVPVTVPVEGADDLQLVMGRASLSGEPPSP